MTEFKGAGVPTTKTKGALGAIYTDDTTGASYKCTNAFIINGVEHYEWKRVSESENEKIPVEKTEENKVEITETSFEQFMNPPVEPEVIKDEPGTDVVIEPVSSRDESVMEGTKPYNKHNYGKYHNKNKNNRN